MFIFTEGIQQEENRTALVNVYLFDLLDHKDAWTCNRFIDDFSQRHR